MALWFVGLSVVIVWAVFRDPALDIRMVVAGVLLPDVVRVALLHTLLASALLLAAMMLLTRRRRRLRRGLLGVPIGLLLHLALDGAWTDPAQFWWPLLGGAWGAGAVPSATRPIAVLALQELAGALALAWCWRAFGLADPGRRRLLIRRGRLEPAGAAEDGPG